MRYYFQSIRMLWRAATQYRASFIMQVISQMLLIGGELLAVVVVLDRFHQVGPWSAGAIMFFFGMMEFTFALTECVGRGVTAFDGVIRSGDFDAILLRPKPVLIQVLCMRLDPRRLGGMLVGAAAMVVANSMLDIAWTAAKVALLLLSALGTTLLVLGLFLIEATMSFFSIRSIEMVNVLTYGGRTACQYPVDIYPDWLRRLFTWVAPFALCMHWPVSAVMGQPMADIPLWAMFLLPVTGLAFFLLMTRVWYGGMKHYRSTGS